MKYFRIVLMAVIGPILAGALSSCCDEGLGRELSDERGFNLKILERNSYYYSYYSEYYITKVEFLGTNTGVNFSDYEYYGYTIVPNPNDTVCNLKIHYYHEDTPATTLTGTVSIHYTPWVDYISDGCGGSELTMSYDGKVTAHSFYSAQLTENRSSSKFDNPLLEIRR